jgi:hypothetical protein
VTPAPASSSAVLQDRRSVAEKVPPTLRVVPWPYLPVADHIRCVDLAISDEAQHLPIGTTKRWHPEPERACPAS